MVNYRGLTIPRSSLGGRITTDNLFDPNEQVIFDFYEANRERYCQVVDIGANVGVHSILMARQGWEVRAYEPDPSHFEALLRNIAAHDVQVDAYRAAVSDCDGTATFVRVLDNLTGSHLAGAKDSYGPRESIDVITVDCRPLFAWADFVKMDCEGHEAAIISMLPAHTWETTDAMLEVGNVHCASVIYACLRYTVSMWAQKNGWARVQSSYDMPIRHQDGSLFIGKRPPF